MQFHYKGINNSFEKVSGIIEAKNLTDAKTKLKQFKITYSHLEEKKDTFGFLKFSSKKIPSNKLSTFSSDLAVYMKAGVPLVNAVRLAKTQSKTDDTMNSFLSSILTFLEEGKSFYQSLELQSTFELPQFYLQSIKISENGGMLEDVLVKMSGFLTEQEKINKQVKNALTYPIFIISVAIGMIAFMLTVVVPKIEAIFDNLHQELPLITKIVLSSAEFFSNYWMFILVFFTSSTIIIKYYLKTNKNFRYYYDFAMLRIPILGKLIETIELGRFAYMSSVLIKSGVPFVQTIRLGSNTLKNSVLQKCFSQAGARVVEGEKFSKSIGNFEYKIEQSFVEAIALGEETSEVAAILENLSLMYFEKNKDKIAVMLSILEPALMLIVGGIIGFIITAMLLPIFSINI